MTRHIRRTTITCRCSAYHFPHHWKGGKCKELLPQQFEDDPKWLDEWAYGERNRIILRPSEEFEYDDELDK